MSDLDLALNPNGTIPNHLQAITSTAGFHFAFIEQGAVAGSEIMHFQTWHDKAGNAPKITDGNLTFPSLNAGVDTNTGASGSAAADAFQTNLIMPAPTGFLNPKLGPVSIIRPTTDGQGGAVASVAGFVGHGLFLDPATRTRASWTC